MEKNTLHYTVCISIFGYPFLLNEKKKTLRLNVVLNSYVFTLIKSIVNNMFLNNDNSNISENKSISMQRTDHNFNLISISTIEMEKEHKAWK